jgi:hypothetical protein
MTEPMQKIVLKVAFNLLWTNFILVRVNSMLPPLMTNNGYMCMFMSWKLSLHINLTNFSICGGMWFINRYNNLRLSWKTCIIYKVCIWFIYWLKVGVLFCDEIWCSNNFVWGQFHNWNLVMFLSWSMCITWQYELMWKLWYCFDMSLVFFYWTHVVIPLCILCS